MRSGKWRARSRALIARLKDLGLLEVRNSEVSLTAHGENRARDIIRRRRLAERLLTDTFSVAESEADSHACKLEHIISPELDQRICTFLEPSEDVPSRQSDSGRHAAARRVNDVRVAPSIQKGKEHFFDLRRAC